MVPTNQTGLTGNTTPHTQNVTASFPSNYKRSNPKVSYEPSCSFTNPSSPLSASIANLHDPPGRSGTSLSGQSLETANVASRSLATVSGENSGGDGSPPPSAHCGEGGGGGMRGENGQDLCPPKEVDRPCSVCGDKANGNYFGAMVCLPCKSFFIRCTKDGEPSIQKQCQGKCDINKQLRNRCQFCRFQRCLAIGMTRKEKPEVVTAEEGQELCRVCGDLANGVHFGVFTCEGCKKFFRRGKSYTCRSSKECLLNPRNRNSCRYCRYQKCLAAGMSRDAIKMGRPRKIFTKPTSAETETFSPTTSTVVTNLASSGCDTVQNSSSESHHDDCLEHQQDRFQQQKLQHRQNLQMKSSSAYDECSLTSPSLYTTAQWTSQPILVSDSMDTMTPAGSTFSTSLTPLDAFSVCGQTNPPPTEPFTMPSLTFVGESGQSCLPNCSQQETDPAMNDARPVAPLAALPLPSTTSVMPSVAGEERPNLPYPTDHPLSDVLAFQSSQTTNSDSWTLSSCFSSPGDHPAGLLRKEDTMGLEHDTATTAEQYAISTTAGITNVTSTAEANLMHPANHHLLAATNAVLTTADHDILQPSNCPLQHTKMLIRSSSFPCSTDATATFINTAAVSHASFHLTSPSSDTFGQTAGTSSVCETPELCGHEHCLGYGQTIDRHSDLGVSYPHLCLPSTAALPEPNLQSSTQSSAQSVVLSSHDQKEKDEVKGCSKALDLRVNNPTHRRVHPMNTTYLQMLHDNAEDMTVAVKIPRRNENTLLDFPMTTADQQPGQSGQDPSWTYSKAQSQETKTPVQSSLRWRNPSDSYLEAEWQTLAHQRSDPNSLQTHQYPMNAATGLVFTNLDKQTAQHTSVTTSQTRASYEQANDTSRRSSCPSSHSRSDPEKQDHHWPRTSRSEMYNNSNHDHQWQIGRVYQAEAGSWRQQVDQYSPRHPQQHADQPSPRHPQQHADQPSPRHPQQQADQQSPRHPQQHADQPSPRHPQQPDACSGGQKKSWRGRNMYDPYINKEEMFKINAVFSSLNTIMESAEVSMDNPWNLPPVSGDPPSEVSCLEDLMLSEYGFSPKQTINYWSRLSAIGKHVPIGREMPGKYQHMLTATLDVYTELLDATDNSKFESNETGGSVWPEGDKVRTYWKAIQQRIVRGTQCSIKCAYKIPGMEDVHPNDKNLLVRRDVIFPLGLLSASTIFFDAEKNDFKHFFNWQLGQEHPMAVFRQCLVAMGRKIFALQMDLNEVALIFALNVVCLESGDFLDQSTLERVMHDLLMTLTTYIACVRKMSPTLRMDSLFRLMPRMRFMGVWHSSLMKNMKFDINLTKINLNNIQLTDA